MMGSNRMPMQS